MKLSVDLEISEMTISDGRVKLSYVVSIETSEFSGPVAGGQSLVTDSEVLEQAQVTLVPVSNAEGEEEFEVKNADDETESQNFANIEKDKWAEILAEMDPDDFKYKM